MGYYTTYTLEYSTDETTTNAVRALIEADDNMRFAIGKDYEGASTKWYDWKKDIAHLSCLYPDILFTLSGEGESTADLWKAYFMGGKMQYAPASITYSEFNPGFLREVGSA